MLFWTVAAVGIEERKGDPFGGRLLAAAYHGLVPRARSDQGAAPGGGIISTSSAGVLPPRARGAGFFGARDGRTSTNFRVLYQL